MYPLLNLFGVIVQLSILFFTNFVFDLNLEQLLILYIITFVFFFFFSYKKLKSIKNMIMSAEVIYCFTFFVYSIMAAVMFILDDYVPRVTFFTIDYDTILETLYLYFNINSILYLLIYLFKGPKSYNFSEKFVNKLKNVNKKLNIWDICAILMCGYFVYLHLKNGLSFMTTNIRDLRLIINSGINNYIYLYMIIYSFIRISEIIYNKSDMKRESRMIINIRKFISIFVILLFWFFSIFTDRRNIINLILILIMAFFSKLKKVSFGKILVIFFIALTFLSFGYFRTGAKFSKEKINSFIYMSTGEFILSHYVSEYYMNNMPELRYGKTYVFDTFTKLIPRKIYPNKPEDLSMEFYKEAKTNVGFAFNPVAEGLINFGKKGAIFIVPIVIMFYINLAYFLGKRNSTFYLIVCGYSINIFRGFFSNSMFAIFVMCVLAWLMLRKFKRVGD